MYPYNEAQKALILQLIIESNPALANLGLTTDNVQISGLTAITPGSGEIQDCQATLTPTDTSSPVLGRKVVYYRRLNLAQLFRNMNLRTDFYFTGNLALSALLAYLNSVYGTAFVLADFSTTDISYAQGQTRQITARPTACYAYTGTLSVYVGSGPRTMAAVLENKVLDGRVFPNGLTTVSAKPQGEYYLYGLDAVYLQTTIAQITTATVFSPATNAAHAALLNYIVSIYPASNLTSSDATVVGGLSGLYIYKVALPNANIPVANSVKFARALYLQSTASSWFTGRMIIHY